MTIFFNIYLFSSLFVAVKAMEPVPFPKRLGQKIANEPKGKKLKHSFELIAQEDGTVFVVPDTIAGQANLIKNYLEYNPHASEMVIPATDISKETLQLVTFVMNLHDTYKHLKGKKLFDVVIEELSAHLLSVSQANSLDADNPLDTYIKLIKAASFLEYKFLFELIARKTTLHSLSEPLFQVYFQRMFVGYADIQNELARWVYLLQGIEPATIDPHTFGFSVRELHDYGRLKMRTGTINQLDIILNPRTEEKGLGEENYWPEPGVLNPAARFFYIDNQRIHNLDGIDELPNATEVEVLLFAIIPNGSLFKVYELSSNYFEKLTKLKLLKLSEVLNKSASIAHGASLPSVEYLDLSYNGAISSWPKEFLNDVPGLKALFIDSCNINEMPADALINLPKLEVFSCARNILKKLPESLFLNSKELKVINLQEAELKNLPNRIFWPLKNATFINLWGNRFHTLPIHLFKNLWNLNTVNLGTSWSENAENWLNITAEFLDNLPPSIKLLDLGDMQGITEESINLARAFQAKYPGISFGDYLLEPRE